MRRRGFTLVESLIAMGLGLIVIVSGLEFFGQARKAFFRLKEKEEATQGALAALDRMRIDLLHAGLGLSGEMGLGLVEAARATAGELRTTSLEERLALSAEARPGDTRVFLESTAAVVARQEVCFSDGSAGEVRSVASVVRGSLVLAEPLGRGYSPKTAAVSLLENVTFFLDGPARILRRRVNAGPAQPLLEDAAAAWLYDPVSRIVRVRLETGEKGANAHGTTVFLKNAALAGTR